MASRALVYSPMFWVIFAPPSMAHWPNRVLSAATRRSLGRFWMARNTFSSVPTPSDCIDFATPSAVMPISFHISCMGPLALLPLLRLV